MPAENPATSARIEKFGRHVAANPDNELARYSLGTALFEAGRFADAEPHFARALELRPDWVLACIFQAKCLLRLGRAQEARGLLERGRACSIEQGHDAPIEEIDALLEMLP